MNKAQQHYKRGNALRAEEHYEEAIAEFEKALALDPHFWLARKSIDFLKRHLEKNHTSLGSVYESEGNIPGAVREFRKALALNPASWRTLSKLGTLHRAHHNYDKAAECFRKAISLSPSTAGLYYALGTIYDLTEEYEAALEQYTLALRFSPHTKEYIHHKRLTQKLAHTKDAFRHSRPSPSLYIDLAAIFVEKGLPEKSILLLKKGLRAFPDNQEILFMLGTIYYTANKFRMAARFYKRALMQPAHTLPAEELHYNLGLALAAQDRWREAITEWEACIHIAPRSRAGLRAHANLDLIRKKKL